MRIIILVACFWLVTNPLWGKIVFSSSRSGLTHKDQGRNDSIFVMDSTGGNIRRLTHDGGIQIDLTWSPDGRHIAWERARQGWDIWVMNVDGNNRQKLTSHVPAGVRDTLWDFAPSWHSDGNRLAFARLITDAEEIHI